MWYVYVLRSEQDGLLYTGYTENVTRRIKEHNNGHVISTTLRRPLTLIYQEKYPTKGEASKREKFLKSGQGRKQLKTLLARGER